MPREIKEIDSNELNEDNKFNFKDFFEGNKISLAGGLVGLILIGIGVFMFKQGIFKSSEKIEILSAESASSTEVKQIVVEISGAVEKPGVYKLRESDRVEDLLIAAGGISANADRSWVEKYINRAAKLSDGQKVFIPDEHSNVSTAKNDVGIKIDQEVLGVSQEGLININTASLNQLDALPGIGQVYGQSIIDHRPYSSVEDLLSKDALKKNVYEKVKDKVTVL